MGINVRTKGQNGEREVAKILQAVVDKVYKDLDLEVPLMKRNLMQSMEGGYDLVGLDWLALEIKFQENENIKAWWAQTLAQANDNQIPVLFYRRSRRKWQVKTILFARGMNYVRPVAGIISLEEYLFVFELQLIERLDK